MEIANTTPSAAAAATSAPVLSSDFETFLKMLTAQMRNQDPLNPIESSDYATQLATFSSVEQQVLTNDLLRNLQSEFGAQGMSQLASWVGMEAKVNAPAYYDGSEIDFVTYPLTGSDSAEVVIRNEAGDEITRFAALTESETLAWDGTNQAGQTVPFGLYQITIDSFKDGELAEQSNAEVYSRVTEARTTSDGVFLVLEGGAISHSNQVTGLRETN